MVHAQVADGRYDPTPYAALQSGPGASWPPLIVVLGMHRSGTSALAGRLCLSGAWAGAPAELMLGDEHNPSGYFERRSVAVRLESLLNELGGSWDYPPLPELRAASVKPHRDRVRELIDELISSAPPGSSSVLKDPRLSLLAATLPCVVPEGTRFVVMVRHPLAVAKSLRKAQRTPLQLGLALWEAYNATIAIGLAGQNVLTIHYDAMLDDGRYEQERIAALLGAMQRPPSKSETGAPLRPELRREQAADVMDAEWVTEPQHQLWQGLQVASRDVDERPMQPVDVSAAARTVLALAKQEQALRASLANADRAAEQAAFELEAANRELAATRVRESAASEALAAASAREATALAAASAAAQESTRLQLELRDAVEAERLTRESAAATLSAIHASESWRVGHALTAPAQWLKRRAGRAAAEPPREDA